MENTASKGLAPSVSEELSQISKEKVANPGERMGKSMKTQTGSFQGGNAADKHIETSLTSLSVRGMASKAIVSAATHPLGWRTLQNSLKSENR